MRSAEGRWRMKFICCWSARGEKCFERCSGVELRWKRPRERSKVEKGDVGLEQRTLEDRGQICGKDVEREGRGEEAEGGARCGDVNLICTNDCALTCNSS